MGEEKEERGNHESASSFQKPIDIDGISPPDLLWFSKPFFFLLTFFPGCPFWVLAYALGVRCMSERGGSKAVGGMTPCFGVDKGQWAPSLGLYR